MNQFINEQEVRKLRAIVFDGDCSDFNWEACKHNWMREDSIKWLKEKAEKS